MSPSTRSYSTATLFIVLSTLLAMIPALPASAADVPEVEVAKLTASDGAAGDLFGWSVAVSGDTAVVGAAEDDDNGARSGAVYVYVRTGTTWTQQAKLTPTDAVESQVFGESLAISGDTVVIGAPGDGDNGSWSGAAYIFTRTGTTWTQQAKLGASDGSPGDNFGEAAAISGDTALIGAHLDEPSGSAYVFTRSGTTWSQQAKLTSPDGIGRLFGLSVAVSDDIAVIGAPAPLTTDEDDSGSAYVFARTDTTWTPQAKLVPSDPVHLNWFGESVAIADDTALIGAQGDDASGDRSGSAYVFARSGTTWAEHQKLSPSDGAAGDRFGISVAFSGNTAIIGAHGDFANGAWSGSAYVFTRSGTTWTEHTKLAPSDGAAHDGFGASVAIAGNTAVIGAYGDDEGGDSSGSAYVFAPRVDTPTCNGLPATIVGTAVRDVLHGTEGDDVIVGLNGNDEIFGEGGNDTICGGSGNDDLYGGLGDDLLKGGSGNDELYGGLGDDLLKGGPDNDDLWDLSGSDELRGGKGNDELEFGAGDDVLIGGRGRDSFSNNPRLEGNKVIRGGPGKDTLSITSDTGPIVVDLGAGTATGVGNYVLESIENVGASSAFDDIVIGDDRNNYLRGDRIEGRGGNDRLSLWGTGVSDGGEGNDVLEVGILPDADYRVAGGPGVDRLRAVGRFQRTSEAVIDLENGTISFPELIGVVSGIENVTGFGTIIGDGGPNVLKGSAGNDTLIGGGGDDILKGLRGDDTLDGDEGNDILKGHRGNDSLDGGDGNDTLYGGRHLDQCVNGETVINCEGPA